MLACFSDDLVGVPGAFVENFLLVGIAFDPPFNAPEDHFHENSLRAGPPAKYSSENHGKKYNKDDECYHADTEDEKILRPKYHSQYREFSFHQVYLQGRILINPDERHGKKYDHIHKTDQRPDIIYSAFGLPCIYPIPVPLFVDCWYPVAEAFVCM